MALWGNKDDVTSAGTVGLNYSTGVVTGSGTAFGAAGSAQVGDVIRFTKGSTYFGDAVITETVPSGVLYIILIIDLQTLLHQHEAHQMHNCFHVDTHFEYET